MKNFILSFVALVSTLTVTAQQYDLQLNLTKGQHFTQSLTTNLDMSQSIAGQDVNITSAMQFEFDQTVKSVNIKGDYVIESQYSHVVLDVDAMGQKMFYDSKVKDTTGSEIMKVYSTLFDEIMGKKFTVVISPKGKVTEIKGLKELLSSLKKASSDPAAQKVIEETFDEKKMASNYESAYRIFPENPVKVGDKWSQKNNVESIFPMEINTTYTLTEVNNGVAKITASGDFKVQNDNMEEAGIKMKTNLSGTYDGVYQMNINTGLSNTSTISMPLHGTMEVMGMEFPVTVNNTVQSATTEVK